ncbi:MAG: dimethylarginine dimethylaminohydrolase family protein [Alphaproteobacteria bacterium]
MPEGGAHQHLSARAIPGPFPGALNEFGPLALVALRHPRDAFVSRAKLAAEWRPLGYHAEPDFAAAIAEYDALVGALADAGVEVLWLPSDPTLTLDSLYVRDAAIVTPAGCVPAAMGKPARASEPALAAAAFTDAGLPVAGTIAGYGRLEGGDLVWLDAQTVVVGRTYRSNDTGIAQLRALVGDRVAVHAFDLPHYKGPGDVFHLMSVWSPLAADLSLVYSPLLPVRLRTLLAERGHGFVEVPDEEFASMGCNVLATAPRAAIVVEGNPKTRARLEAAGVAVTVLKADEISRKGEGGPTCLTRPLLRR